MILSETLCGCCKKTYFQINYQEKITTSFLFRIIINHYFQVAYDIGSTVQKLLALGTFLSLYFHVFTDCQYKK